MTFKCVCVSADRTKGSGKVPVAYAFKRIR